MTLENKNQMSPKSMSMDICIIGTINQLIIRCSYTQTKFSKK